MVHSDGNLIKLSGKSKFVLINKFDNFAAKLLALCSSYTIFPSYQIAIVAFELLYRIGLLIPLDYSLPTMSFIPLIFSKKSFLAF